MPTGTTIFRRIISFSRAHPEIIFYFILMIVLDINIIFRGEYKNSAYRLQIVCNLVPRVFSAFKMAARQDPLPRPAILTAEKTLGTRLRLFGEAPSLTSVKDLKKDCSKSGFHFTGFSLFVLTCLVLLFKVAKTQEAFHAQSVLRLLIYN